MIARMVDLAILGAGPAGLAAALHAQRSSIRFDVFEAGDSAGGNCRTLRFGDFLVDTGAHRLHDKDPDTTAFAHDLLGEDLLRVSAPSQLHHDGRLIDFPLAPLSLLRSLPLRTLAAIVGENLRLRLSGVPAVGESFGELARSTYGDTLARIALLDYSRKLWGCDPDDLLPEAAGARLGRLDLKTFLLESISGRHAAHLHLDGAFLYPRRGIGQLFARAAERLAPHVHVAAPITRLHHAGGRIVSFAADGMGTVEPMHVINTLPLGTTIRLLEPTPPDDILAAARAVRFRNLRLCVLLVARERFTSNASIYFPDSEVPFTRLYEPKNRSRAMAPDGATSLVMEVPCGPADPVAQLDSATFISRMLNVLDARIPLPDGDIIDAHDVTIPNAYPILDRASATGVDRARAYLASFENMQMVGRNASFRYTSIHDTFKSAARAVERARSSAPRFQEAG